MHVTSSFEFLHFHWTYTAAPCQRDLGHSGFRFLKKLFFWYMIVHIKPDIVAKFGGKINTGSMIKLSLNLVSIFSQHFSRNIDISDAKNARSELVAWCMTTHVITCVHTRYTHFRVTYLSRSVSLNRVLLPQTFLCCFLLVACSLWFSSREKKRQTPVKRSKYGPLASSRRPAGARRHCSPSSKTYEGLWQRLKPI